MTNHKKPDPIPPDPLEVLAKSLGHDVDDPLLYSGKSARGGIRCPHCNSPHHEVIDTRISELKPLDKQQKEFIRRWRRCERCGLTFPTREVGEPEIPDMIKTPQQVAQVSKKIKKVLENVLPVTPEKLPDLPNPFL